MHRWETAGNNLAGFPHKTVHWIYPIMVFKLPVKGACGILLPDQDGFKIEFDDTNCPGT